MKCPKCGSEIPEDSEYCFRCEAETGVGDGPFTLMGGYIWKFRRGPQSKEKKKHSD